jgi:hypothetical protein
VKHQYVENIKDYPYSSFHQFLEKQGRDNLVNQFKDNSDYKKLYSDQDDYKHRSQIAMVPLTHKYMRLSFMV